MRIAIGLLILALAVVPAHANVVATGSIGFSTPFLSEASASPTGNINTSVLFQLDSLRSTNNTSGIFANLPIQDFGTVIFNTTIPTSLTISDAAFGKFSSSSITTEANGGGFLDLLALGKWFGGTFDPSACKAGCEARMRLSLTQTPVSVGEISFSATMSTIAPPPTVPEPNTALLFMTGTGLILVGSRLRRFLLA